MHSLKSHAYKFAQFHKVETINTIAEVIVGSLLKRTLKNIECEGQQIELMNGMME